MGQDEQDLVAEAVDGVKALLRESCCKDKKDLFLTSSTLGAKSPEAFSRACCTAPAHRHDCAASTLALTFRRDGVSAGRGSYGRVRLAESPMIKETYPHHPSKGYFAIKILKKSEIVRLKQAAHVKTERDLLLNKLAHPFVVTAYCTYHDERNLYMVMEFIQGGELLSECREASSKLENDVAQFYAAQLCMAMQYLHVDPHANIVFRGLVPENILIDHTGYLKLVDFGLAKKIVPTAEPGSEFTYTLCGTAEYLAPEMIKRTGHGKGVDWYAYTSECARVDARASCLRACA